MKRLTYYSLILLFALLTGANQNSVAQGKPAKIACVAFYNLENLFDTIDDPITDDVEFTPNGPSRWNSERYYAKLKNLAKVISQIGDDLTKDGPIMMGVSEVENRQVVEDLLNTPPLKEMGYKVVHYDSPDKRGIDVSFIYRSKFFQVTSSSAHPFKIENLPDFYTRDILQVDGTLEGEKIHVLVNHWPSRSGGEVESRFKRNAAADLCLSIVQSIYKEEPNAKIIIMGDLNDDPVDESLMKHLKVKTKPENTGPGDLFDPMWQMYKDGIGSLAYKDSWNLFDQIIVSGPLMAKNNTGYRFLKARIFKKSFMLQKEGAYEGYPFRTYAAGVYMGGYSDHFPAYIFLVKEVKK
ncbi:MAG: endonuclease/exonuclease/phosphatase family protein [Bacteroidetes bacterium]|nr:endonuclease/exonuclease/phosphatase family protein [Bacteroidota bacterium]